MEIRLEATPEPGLRAVLHNSSGSERAVLHSPKVQPSRIVLTDAAGKEIVPFDERTRRKFDTTVRAASFAKLPAGGDLQLGMERFRTVAPGVYELVWGPYRYRQIPPGIWKASIVFDCKIDSSTKGGPVAGAWLGRVGSNTVEVRLD